MRAETLVDVERIQRAVLRVRSQNVMLDSDLAALYGVDVRVLNQAVARNADRFPSDFMLQLTAEEAESLRSQFVILKNGRGRHRKYLRQQVCRASIRERPDQPRADLGL